jgi:hypothetical protein
MDVSRLAISTASFLTGFMLILPSKVFPIYGIGQGVIIPPYAIMAVFAPEMVWAALFIIHGVFSFSCLMWRLNGPLSLIFDALLGSILWSITTVSYLVSRWPYDVSFWDG